MVGEIEFELPTPNHKNDLVCPSVNGAGEIGRKRGNKERREVQKETKKKERNTN